MQKLKIRSKDYNRILVCSDLHYGHDQEFLYDPRGFSNKDDHKNWIRTQIESLDPDDLLICLGDVGLSVGPTEIIDFLNIFPCKTYMTWGNHNSGVFQLYRQNLPKGFEKCEVYPLRITPNITIMGDSFILEVDKWKFRAYCTHMSPLVFPDMSKGTVALCGHSHANLKQINPDRDDFGKILDIGVDNAITHNGTAFFSLDEIKAIMATKKASTFDHH